ncbi:MAG: zinc-ribbon domain-containing protein [Clostridiales bacterium]|jgi:hypothetical protein|nr:zinc-ribbon domain-containing protein [Clostridiales bacterium]MDR2750027.1 zinc-ribbon domain-containing protein [Clostridiales bacterium]
MMTTCPNCNAPLKANSVFCVKCGERIAEYRYCANPECKAKDARCDDDDIHCRVCGSPTVAQYPAPPPEPPKVEEDRTWIVILTFIAALVMFYLTK